MLPPLVNSERTLPIGICMYVHLYIFIYTQCLHIHAYIESPWSLSPFKNLLAGDNT